MGRIRTANGTEQKSASPSSAIPTSVFLLRKEGSAGGMHMAGFVEMAAGTMPYEFSGDETIYVQSGSLRIDVGTKSVELSAGAMATFNKGDPSTWTIHEPLRALFVISDS